MQRVLVTRCREDECGRAIDVRVAPPTPFVGDLSRVAEATENETVLDPGDNGFVQGEPGDCTDSAGNEEEPVRISQRPLGQQLREADGNGDAGEIVVAKRGMADVAGEEHLVRGTAREEALSKRQIAVFQ